MSVSAQIRAALRKSGEPMSLDLLADANDWDQDARSQAHKNLYAMKKSGEITTLMEEGKPHYALVAGYVPKRGGPPKKTRGPSIHFARGDKTPKAAPLPDLPKSMQAAADEASAALRSAPTLAASPAVHPLQQEADQLAGRTRSDFDLHKRIDAIASDIEDALTDAFDADHDKNFIKHLLTAHTSISRAVRAYPRN